MDFLASRETDGTVLVRRLAQDLLGIFLGGFRTGLMWPGADLLREEVKKMLTFCVNCDTILFGTEPVASCHNCSIDFDTLVLETREQLEFEKFGGDFDLEIYHRISRFDGIRYGCRLCTLTCQQAGINGQCVYLMSLYPALV